MQGKITAQEFKLVAAELGESISDEEVDKIFQKTNFDQNDYITAEDFYEIMSRKGNYE